MDNIVELEGAVRTYHRGVEDVKAIDGVDLSISPGEFISVVGRSGSGKTTLLNLIGCVDKPTSGRVNVHGMETEDLTDNQLATIRSTTIGFVFQQFFLIPTLTAIENVMVPGRFCARRNRDLAQRARGLLDLVGLSDRADHLPSELSGGEMQRVAIARALINEPAILLADEPTGNLDTKSAAEIAENFDVLNERGLTIVVVTHSPEIAENATRSVRLEDGRIIEDRQLRPAPVPRGEVETVLETVSAPEYMPAPQKQLNWGTLITVCSLFILGLAMFAAAFLPFLGSLSGTGLLNRGLFTVAIHGSENLTQAFVDSPAILFTGLWPIVLGLFLVLAGILFLFKKRRLSGWATAAIGLLGVMVAVVNLIMIESRLGEDFSGAYGLWFFLGVAGAAVAVGVLLVVLQRLHGPVPD